MSGIGVFLSGFKKTFNKSTNASTASPVTSSYQKVCLIDRPTDDGSSRKLEEFSRGRKKEV